MCAPSLAHKERFEVVGNYNNGRAGRGHFATKHKSRLFLHRNARQCKAIQGKATRCMCDNNAVESRLCFSLRLRHVVGKEDEENRLSYEKEMSSMSNTSVLLPGMSPGKPRSPYARCCGMVIFARSPMLSCATPRSRPEMLEGWWVGYRWGWSVGKLEGWGGGVRY